MFGVEKEKVKLLVQRIRSEKMVFVYSAILGKLQVEGYKQNFSLNFLLAIFNQIANRKKLPK